MNLQEDFAKALLAPDQPCPDGLFSNNGADPASRFAVYRNNVHSSLINALLDSYPVTRQLVGDGFFRAMAGLYVQAYPPTNPLLNEYGSDLADFIQGFAPAATVPYLADVARLERLRVNAYHAADTPVADPQAVINQLQQLPSLGSVSLQLHPSVATLQSNYAVVALWAAHQTTDSVASLDPWHGQSALVLRNGLEVEVFCIDAGCVTFINSLNNAWPLEMAVAYALDASSEFDLHQCLGLLISHRAITHIKVQP
ncbi:putative DNA-binding domain-containing protein [Pseudomonas brenneri]|uniref:HvfC/BufC family peptide modification chaperone n=1 Tax=Pseudomonas brenneri TaxID=129817 RepID=UPI003BA06830